MYIADAVATVRKSGRKGAPIVIARTSKAFDKSVSRCRYKGPGMHDTGMLDIVRRIIYDKSRESFEPSRESDRFCAANSRKLIDEVTANLVSRG